MAKASSFSNIIDFSLEHHINSISRIQQQKKDDVPLSIVMSHGQDI